ncbi:MAG: pentapeptide repeat-containing protein [Pseudomonadota bacterium]
MTKTNGLAVRWAMALLLSGASAVAATAQDTDRSGDITSLGDCEGCVFRDRDFSERRLMGLNLEGADLSGIAFDRAGLGIAVFDDAVLERVSFDGADLRGASFVGTRLVDVTFVDADLRGAVFEGAILDGTDLQPALLCNTQMPDDSMENSDCG